MFFRVFVVFVVFQNKKTVFKNCMETGTRARLIENKQIQCYNNPLKEAYEAPYIKRLFFLCKKASLGLQSRTDLHVVMGYQLTQRIKTTKKYL